MKTYILGNQDQVSCVAVFSDKKVYLETKLPRKEKAVCCAHERRHLYNGTSLSEPRIST